MNTIREVRFKKVYEKVFLRIVGTDFCNLLFVSIVKSVKIDKNPVKGIYSLHAIKWHLHVNFLLGKVDENCTKKLMKVN